MAVSTFCDVFYNTFNFLIPLILVLIGGYSINYKPPTSLSDLMNELKDVSNISMRNKKLFYLIYSILTLSIFVMLLVSFSINDDDVANWSIGAIIFSLYTSLIFLYFEKHLIMILLLVFALVMSIVLLVYNNYLDTVYSIITIILLCIYLTAVSSYEAYEYYLNMQNKKTMKNINPEIYTINNKDFLMNGIDTNMYYKEL